MKRLSGWPQLLGRPFFHSRRIATAAGQARQVRGGRREGKPQRNPPRTASSTHAHTANHRPGRHGHAGEPPRWLAGGYA